MDTGLNKRNLNTDGQSNRQRNELAVRDLIKKLCPIDYLILVARISAEMHLSPNTVKYSFLNVLFRTGFITNDEYDIVYLKGTEPQKPQEPQIDYTKESEQKEQLTQAIQTELSANPKLTESDIIQKFSTKEIDEAQVKFCYDIAKNRILIKSQKNESFLKSKNLKPNPHLEPQGESTK